jgi:hypothetical protein
MGRLRNSDAEDKPGFNPSAIILPCGRYASFPARRSHCPLPNLAPSWNVAPTDASSAL